MIKLIRLNLFKNYKSINLHGQCRNLRRHSRPGATSEVGLKELIIDKPPNEYPTIKQKLNRINYYDNPIRTKNIGFDTSSEAYLNFIKQSNNFLLKQNKTSISDNENEDYDDENVKNIELSNDDYDKLSSIYSFTQSYVESTNKLAHHYGIYRDLFFQQPFVNETEEELIIANAKDEVKFHKFENRELYHFYPLIPVTAIFSNQNNENEMTYLKSFRGNLIPAEFGQKMPQIQINTSAIIDSNLDVECSSSNLPITINSGEKNDPNFYTLALVNLDSHFNDIGVCHWLIANISNNVGNETTYDTIIDYLPIYGIRGLGYHRYVFVLFQSNKRIENLERITDFDLGKRKFNGLEFMSKCASNNSDVIIKPIGLSWFQTTYSDYCKSIFHNILDMRCPTYEYIFPKQITQFNQLQYPGRAPFNLYLDAFRHPKDLSKEVLLERLKAIDPMKSYDTDKMFQTWEGRPKFPHIHPHPPNTPDWLKSTLIRKRAHEGRYRGLRASSAILPHNNNADLDCPKWPRISPNVHPINMPNPYPDGKRRPKPLRNTLWSKPLPDHHSLRIDFADNLQSDDKTNYEKTPSSSSS